jgi:tetratricopeptide (TPR) repeat protein
LIFFFFFYRFKSNYIAHISLSEACRIADVRSPQQHSTITMAGGKKNKKGKKGKNSRKNIKKQSTTSSDATHVNTTSEQTTTTAAAAAAAAAVVATPLTQQNADIPVDHEIDTESSSSSSKSRMHEVKHNPILVQATMSQVRSGMKCLGDGEFDKGLDLLTQAHATFVGEFGAHNINAISALQNIGSAHRLKGDLAKSREVLEHALSLNEIAEEETTESDKDMTTLLLSLRQQTMHELGVTLRKSGELENALVLQNSSCDLLKQISPDAKTDTTLAVMHNSLGVTYKESGKFDEAIAQYCQALEIFEAAYGADHPSSVTVLLNYAAVCGEQNKSDQTLELLEKALKIQKPHLGESHPSVAKTLLSIGAALHDKGEEPAKELEYYEKAYSIYAATLGSTHSEAANALRFMAGAHERLGDNDKCIELLIRAADAFQESLPGGHPMILQSVQELASKYAQFGDMEKAELCIYAAVKAQRGQPMAALTLLEVLSEICQKEEQWERALVTEQQVLTIKQSLHGPRSVQVAASLIQRGAAQNELKQFDEAVESLEAALRIFISKRVHTREIAQLLCVIAIAYYENGEYVQAKQATEKGVLLYRETLKSMMTAEAEQELRQNIIKNSHNGAGPSTLPDICLMCGTSPMAGTKLLRCSGCIQGPCQAMYCSKQCQVTHWKQQHKLLCARCNMINTTKK